jgi:hypothetical protein
LGPKRLKEWLDYQKKFIKGRQKSFEREVACMDERARGPVKDLFCHFGEALGEINELIENANKFKKIM